MILIYCPIPILFSQQLRSLLPAFLQETDTDSSPAPLAFSPTGAAEVSPVTPTTDAGVHDEREPTRAEPSSSPSGSSAESPDGIWTYASVVLELGLLFLELEDIGHDGNGDRNNTLWKVLMFFFRATGHHKYALQALLRTAQVSALLSPRMSEHLTWSQFSSAKNGSNKPNDLLVEHNNRELKGHLKAMGANKTIRATQRRALSSVCLSDIASQFVEDVGAQRTYGRHTRADRSKDVSRMVGVLREQKVFTYQAGRLHSYFPRIASPLKKFEDRKARKLLQSWLKGHKKLLARKKLYDGVFTPTPDSGDDGDASVSASSSSAED